MCHILYNFIWGVWWFHSSKDFEAMQARKLAIPPWLSCQYNENTLVDLPSSVISSNMAKVEMAKDTYSFSNVIFLLLFEGTNSININLQTCNLQTNWSISYKSVNQLQLSLFYWNDKKFSRSNGNFSSYLIFFCHLNVCHNRKKWLNTLLHCGQLR